MSPPAGPGGAAAGGPLVWVTRAEPGAAKTADRLRDLGFEPLVAPLIATRDLPGPPPDVAGAQALAFTSARGVHAFVERLAPPPLPVFTVGDATAEAARRAGFADVRSASGSARDLLALIFRDAPPAAEVLYAGAREPAFDLVAALRLVGRPARAAALYETVPVESLPRAAAAALARGAVAAVLLHSPAAARALAACGKETSGKFATTVLTAISLDCILPLAGTPFASVQVAAAPDESSLLKALEDALLGAGPAPR